MRGADRAYVLCLDEASGTWEFFPHDHAMYLSIALAVLNAMRHAKRAAIVTTSEDRAFRLAGRCAECEVVRAEVSWALKEEKKLSERLAL